jgi:hypothetical protein
MAFTAVDEGEALAGCLHAEMHFSGYARETFESRRGASSAKSGNVAAASEILLGKREKSCSMHFARRTMSRLLLLLCAKQTKLDLNCALCIIEGTESASSRALLFVSSSLVERFWLFQWQKLREGMGSAQLWDQNNLCKSQKLALRRG